MHDQISEWFLLMTKMKNKNKDGLSLGVGES